MISSNNVVPLTKNQSHAWQEKSPVLAPMSRVLKSVYTAIDTIVSERESIQEILKQDPGSLGKSEIEDLLQSIRILATDITAREYQNIVLLSNPTARSKNLVVYVDNSGQWSIVIESTHRQKQNIEKGDRPRSVA